MGIIMYRYIINPETGNKFNINSKIGKKMIKNYLNLLELKMKGGASEDNNSQNNNEESDEIYWNKISEDFKCNKLYDTVFKKRCEDLVKEKTKTIQDIINNAKNLLADEDKATKNKDYDEAKEHQMKRYGELLKAEKLINKLPEGTENIQEEFKQMELKKQEEFKQMELEKQKELE